MEFIKDLECTIDTPVVFGAEESPIYNKGHNIFPRIEGKKNTEHDKKTYLPHLLPLEEYDLIIVLFSGGKDSLAAYLKLLELGVPKEKIELWHHDIDGGHPKRKMDWKVTKAYVRAFAKAEKVKLRRSWRVNGFWGEVYRVGSSMPIQYDDNGSVKQIPLSKKQIRSDELRKQITEGEETDAATRELESYGKRLKFPAKTGSLMTRWCSAYLKVMVADSVIRQLDTLGKAYSKILVISGERRGESSTRAKLNEMEIHRTNATKRSNRLVHQWRPVIDHSERDIWEIIRRHKIVCHPCYRAGWNRCSCMMCIFSLPKHWAGIRELFPKEVEAVKHDEEVLGFTLDNKADLESYIGDTKSCLYHDEDAIRQIVTGKFRECDVYTENWKFPAGAFHGAAGGPC